MKIEKPNVLNLFAFFLLAMILCVSSTALAQNSEPPLAERLSCDYCIDVSDGESVHSRSMYQSSSGSSFALRLSAEFGAGLLGGAIGVGVFLGAVWFNHMANLTARNNSAASLMFLIASIVASAVAIVVTPTAVTLGGHSFGGEADPTIALIGGLIGGLPGIVMVMVAFGDKRATIDNKAIALAVTVSGQILGAMVAYEISHRTGWVLPGQEESAGSTQQMSLFQYRWSF